MADAMIQPYFQNRYLQAALTSFARASLPCTRLSLDSEIDCCPIAECEYFSRRLASLLEDVGQPSLSAIRADCATGGRSRPRKYPLQTWRIPFHVFQK